MTNPLPTVGAGFVAVLASTLMPWALAACNACRDEGLPSAPAASVDAPGPFRDTGSAQQRASADVTATSDSAPGIEFVDAGDSQTAADAAADVTTVADPLCTATPMPEPGEACAKAGATTCTNFGGKKWTGNNPYCIRPHFLECVAGTDGKLRWALRVCEAVAPEHVGICAPKGGTCLLADGSHKCVATLIGPQFHESIKVKTKTGVTDIHVGTVYLCAHVPPVKKCHGGQIEVCTTLAGTGSLAPGLEKAYGFCAQYVKSVPYAWLPVEVCLEYLYCPSKCPMGVDCNKLPPPKEEYVTMCMIDPDTKQPRCQETCKDVGAPWY